MALWARAGDTGLIAATVGDLPNNLLAGVLAGTGIVRGAGSGDCSLICMVPAFRFAVTTAEWRVTLGGLAGGFAERIVPVLVLD